MFISQGIRDLGQLMIIKPHEWTQTQYEFINRERNIVVWTSNGTLMISITGVPSLGLFEKFYINRCIKQSVANKLIFPEDGNV